METENQSKSFWNAKVIPQPPITTYKTTSKNIDIKCLQEILEEAQTFFEKDKYLEAEHSVLSRINYRMKQKFRSAKDFKALEKLNKALRIYFNTNLSMHISMVISLIPKKYKKETYLPAKNLVDYILVRLQGLVKLFERIVETCKIAAYLFKVRIDTGHFWKIAFIIFALVSRVYILAKYSAKFICKFYMKLLPFSHKLKNNGTSFLPNNYQLPKDLKEWMEVDWLDMDDEVQVIEMPTDFSDIMKYFDLVDDDDDEDDDVEISDEYIMIDEDEVEIVKEFPNLKPKQTKKSENNNLSFNIRNLDEDIEEVIEINDQDQQETTLPLSCCNVEDVGEIIEIPDTNTYEDKKKTQKAALTLFKSIYNNENEDLGEIIDINENFSSNETKDNENFSINIVDGSLDNSVIVLENDENENSISASECDDLEIVESKKNMEKSSKGKRYTENQKVGSIDKTNKIFTANIMNSLGKKEKNNVDRNHGVNSSTTSENTTLGDTGSGNRTLRSNPINTPLLSKKQKRKLKNKSDVNSTSLEHDTVDSTFINTSYLSEKRNNNSKNNTGIDRTDLGYKTVDSTPMSGSVLNKKQKRKLKKKAVNSTIVSESKTNESPSITIPYLSKKQKKKLKNKSVSNSIISGNKTVESTSITASHLSEKPIKKLKNKTSNSNGSEQKTVEITLTNNSLLSKKQKGKKKKKSVLNMSEDKSESTTASSPCLTKKQKRKLKNKAAIKTTGLENKTVKSTTTNAPDVLGKKQKPCTKNRTNINIAIPKNNKRQYEENIEQETPPNKKRKKHGKK